MRILIAIGAVIAAGLIVWGIWSLLFSGSTPSKTSPTGTSFPVASSTGTGLPLQQQAPVIVQQIPSPQDPTVASNFKGQIQNADQIALGGTVIVSPYALQVWGDENKGGEALLEYASSTGWTLVSLGGGEWTVDGLMEAGVPQSYAQQLVAGLGN